MRTNPTRIGRALADRLQHRRTPRAPTIHAAVEHDASGDLAVRPASRTRRLRSFLAASRVTPYQLRRGLLW